MKNGRENSNDMTKKEKKKNENREKLNWKNIRIKEQKWRKGIKKAKYKAKYKVKGRKGCERRRRSKW